MMWREEIVGRKSSGGDLVEGEGGVLGGDALTSMKERSRTRHEAIHQLSYSYGLT